jgi:hypothetical protein
VDAPQNTAALPCMPTCMAAGGFACIGGINDPFDCLHWSLPCSSAQHSGKQSLIRSCWWCACGVVQGFLTTDLVPYYVICGQRNRETTPSSAVAWASTHGPAVRQAADARPHTHKPSHQRQTSCSSSIHMSKYASGWHRLRPLLGLILLAYLGAKPTVASDTALLLTLTSNSSGCCIIFYCVLCR